MYLYMQMMIALNTLLGQEKRKREPEEDENEQKKEQQKVTKKCN